MLLDDALPTSRKSNLMQFLVSNAYDDQPKVFRLMKPLERLAAQGFSLQAFGLNGHSDQRLGLQWP